MPFSSLCRDVVTLEKKNGQRFTNISASVQRNKIYICPKDEKEYSIEVGDIISRDLPNGTIERYEVEDPGFYSSIGGIPSHYQITVRRCDAKRSVSNVHISAGDNSKIMVHSTDNSINVQITKDNMWEQLSEVIKLQCNNQSDLLELVAEMKGTQGTPKFKEKYQAFMALAANHMAVLGPFIPMLSSLL